MRPNLFADGYAIPTVHTPPSLAVCYHGKLVTDTPGQWLFCLPTWRTEEQYTLRMDDGGALTYSPRDRRAITTPDSHSPHAAAMMELLRLAAGDGEDHITPELLTAMQQLADAYYPAYDANTTAMRYVGPGGWWLFAEYHITTYRLIYAQAHYGDYTIRLSGRMPGVRLVVCRGGARVEPRANHTLRVRYPYCRSEIRPQAFSRLPIDPPALIIAVSPDGKQHRYEFSEGTRLQYRMPDGRYCWLE